MFGGYDLIELTLLCFLVNFFEIKQHSLIMASGEPEKRKVSFLLKTHGKIFRINSKPPKFEALLICDGFTSRIPLPILV